MSSCPYIGHDNCIGIRQIILSFFIVPRGTSKMKHNEKQWDFHPKRQPNTPCCQWQWLRCWKKSGATSTIRWSKSSTSSPDATPMIPVANGLSPTKSAKSSASPQDVAELPRSTPHPLLADRPQNLRQPRRPRHLPPLAPHRKKVITKASIPSPNVWGNWRFESKIEINKREFDISNRPFTNKTISHLVLH